MKTHNKSINVNAPMAPDGLPPARYSRHYTRMKYLLLSFLLLSSTTYGLTPIEHKPQVIPSLSKSHYAKILPGNKHGIKEEGEIHIYEITKDIDKKLLSYNWYNNNIYLAKSCDHFTLVSIYPISKGTKAKSSDIAIEVYQNKTLAYTVSTLDLAKSENNIESLGPYYTALDMYGKPPRFGIQKSCPEQQASEPTWFMFSTHDKNNIWLNLKTGELKHVSTKKGSAHLEAH